MALFNVPRCRWGSCLYGQTGVRKAAGNRVHYFTTPTMIGHSAAMRVSGPNSTSESTMEL